MGSYFSLFLYILTFIGGFLLDSPSLRGNQIIRKVYVVWLYIFLCFGYMTGADWRSYEVVYNDWNDVMDKDYGYVYTTNFIHHFISDFWIVFDIFRCLFLWSVLKVLKYLSHYWLSAASFLMPLSLLSLTVDSPFRFMIALMLLNFSILLLIKSKYLLAALLCVIAVTFHTSVIVVVPFVFLIKTGIFVKAKNWVLLFVYLVVIVFTTRLDIISNLQSLIGLAFSDFGLNSYKSYTAEISVNVLSFGSIIQILLFLFVIYTRQIVVQNTPNGSLVTNMAILYFYIQRIGMAIPTGHRFCWFFSLFVAVYFADLFHVNRYRTLLNNKVLHKSLQVVYLVFILFYGATMTKTIVNHFAYIPYSNSIPYIIMGHKPYAERDKYNLDAYKQRTGESFILNSDQ